jgi:hypothetical protein
MFTFFKQWKDFSLSFMVIFLTAGFGAHAAPLSVLDDVMRSSAKVADDIPLQSADDIIERISKSSAAREVIEKEMKSAGYASDALEGATTVAKRSEAFTEILRKSAGNLDPAVLATLRNADETVQGSAIVLAKGGNNVAEVIPDLAARSRFLREGGADTLAAVGMYGSDAAKAAMRVDAALRSGVMVIPNGCRKVTLSDFGRVMSQVGGASWTFWKRYVEPHWKVWAGCGAAALYLANPDWFQDQAGNMTEKGFEHLTKLAGEAAASTIRGISEGSKEAGSNIFAAIKESFFSSWDSMFAVVGVLVFVVLLGLLFRRTRYYLMTPFRWLNQTPAKETPKKKSKTRS